MGISILKKNWQVPQIRGLLPHCRELIVKYLYTLLSIQFGNQLDLGGREKSLRQPSDVSSPDLRLGRAPFLETVNTVE